MAGLGRACLLLALAVCAYGIGASLYGVRSGRTEFAESGRRSVYALAVILTVAIAVLEIAFLRDDFDVTRVAGIYNVGSGSAGVAEAIEQAGLADEVGIVAHDLTERHRALLGANKFTYVLHQDIHYCVLTAARVLRALCENVRGALNVVQPRIEILTAENLH